MTREVSKADSDPICNYPDEEVDFSTSNECVEDGEYVEDPMDVEENFGGFRTPSTSLELDSTHHVNGATHDGSSELEIQDAAIVNDKNAGRTEVISLGNDSSELEIPVIKRQRRKRAKKVNLARFIQHTCRQLQEPKVALVSNAIDTLGLDVFKNLLREVDAIQKCGGQLTVDGKRRRTPGGVLWNIVKSRVSPQVFKKIMLSDVELQRRKEKDKERAKRRKLKERSIKAESVANDLPRSATGATCLFDKESLLGASRTDLSCGAAADEIVAGGKIVEWNNAWARAVVAVDDDEEELLSSPFCDKAATAAPSDQKKIEERIRRPVDYEGSGAG